LQKGKLTFEPKWVTKDGKEVYGEMEILTVYGSDGKFAGNRRVFCDITEHKNSEEALKNSEEKFRTFMETASDLMFITDKDGNYTYVNESTARTLGYSKEEMIGMNIAQVISKESFEKDTISKVKKELIKKGKLFFEDKWIRKDGKEVCGEIKFVSFFDSDGKFIGVRGVFRDITEKKEAEESLRESEEKLARSKKIEALGLMASGIAHDFNNILTRILGNISLAKRYVEPREKVFNNLVEAEKASLLAKDLTQQLLTFAKGGTPIKKTIYLKELIKDSTSLALGGSNGKCEFSLTDDLLPVEVDEGQISRVISNLVINADEAMPDGRTLNVQARNITNGEKHDLPLYKGKYVEITIRDQGIGIPKEHLEKIFEPYFTTKQRGIGLGLPITYSIIKNHDGYITVKSLKDVGTTFYIYLPASKNKSLQKRK
jgi:PAS domain S-box-containing protein